MQNFQPSAGIVLNPNISAGPSDFTMPTGSNLDINKVIFSTEHYSGDLCTPTVSCIDTQRKLYPPPGLPEQDQEAVGEKGGEGFDEAAFIQPALEHHIAA